jgi:hypothetical protein
MHVSIMRDGYPVFERKMKEKSGRVRWEKE